MTPRPSEQGFTLIELLVSLAILALMAATLLSGLVTGRRAWERIETRANDGEQISAAQTMIRSLVDRIFPQGEFRGSRPTVQFSGNPKGMSFQSAPLDAAGPSPPWRYRLTLSPAGSLDLDMLTALARDPARARKRQTLIEGIRSIEFAYYGAVMGDNRPRWRTHWGRQPALPQRIRVRAAFAHNDRRHWPELVVQPAATIDTFCVFDVNSGRCRGR